MMAFEVTRSSSLMLPVLLLTLSVCVEALPVEKLVELRSHDLNETSDAVPFDAEQYKEYLSNFKCLHINILHEGDKIPEVATGTIYQPTTTPPPIPPLEPLLPNQSSPPPSALPPLKLLLPNSPPRVWPKEVPTTQHTTTPITEVPTAHQTNAPTSAQPTTETPTTENVPATQQLIRAKSLLGNVDKLPEYDGDVNKKSDKQNGNEPDPKKNQSYGIDKGAALSGGEVNGTSSNNNKECTAPFVWGRDKYNWYQILLDNGGPPGGYLQSRALKANLTKVVDPCSRPILHSPPAVVETTFGFTHIEFEKVYRSEQVHVRFPGMPQEFLDVSGQLIWSPPNSKRRYYHFSYRKDDTGLYFNLNQRQRCVFQSGLHVQVSCEYTTLVCDCENGEEFCFDPLVPPPAAAGIPSGLAAALVGGGR